MERRGLDDLPVTFWNLRLGGDGHFRHGKAGLLQLLRHGVRRQRVHRLALDRDQRLVGLWDALIAVGAGEHLQDDHHQLVPRFQRPAGEIVVAHGSQLLLQRAADGVGDEAHLADDVALGDVDLGVGPARGVGTTDVINVAREVVSEDPGSGAEPEVGQVAHAQRDILLVDCAVLLEE
jgi:hypothetical protein